MECGGEKILTGSGSTAQANAVKRFNEAYQNACPGRTVDYTVNGSGAGISDFIAGRSDFAGSDSPLAADQYAAAKQRCGGADAWNLPVVFGPLAVTYNLHDVDFLVLDAPTLANIFNGTIKRWDDPAISALNASMPSEDIHVVYRSDASGTTDNFQHYLQAASGGAWNMGAGKVLQRRHRHRRERQPRALRRWSRTPKARSPTTSCRSPLIRGSSPRRSRLRQAESRCAQCGSAPTPSARPSPARRLSAKATTSYSTSRRSTTRLRATSTRS